MKPKFRIALFVILVVHLFGYPNLTRAQENPAEPEATKRIYLPFLSRGGSSLLKCQLGFPRQTSSDQSMETETLAIINQQRASKGSPALKTTDSLVQLARFHSNDMAKNDLLSHSGSAGEGFGERMSWGCDQYSYAGEIIGWGYSSPESVVQGWLDSPAHRAILLDGKYSAAGAGYANHKTYGKFWTVDFITQVQSNSLASEPDQAPIECKTFTEQVGEGTIMATICE